MSDSGRAVRSITFLEPWGRRSWKVKYDGPYDNDRPPHVELGEAGMSSVKAGDMFLLSNLQCTGTATKGAIMWEVMSVPPQATLCNLRNPARPCRAHFTVYFGSNPYDKIPAFV